MRSRTHRTRKPGQGHRESRVGRPVARGPRRRVGRVRRRVGRVRRVRGRAPRSSGGLGQGREEAARPAGHVVGEDPAAQSPHPRADLARIHRDGLLDGGLEPVDVVRVDQQRAAQLVGGAGELREHQHSAVVDARGDELLGDQVHPVAQRRHEHDVGGTVEGRHLLRRVGVVQVMDGLCPDPAVLAVDPADQELDLLAQLLVGPDVLPAGAGHLDEGCPRHLEPSLGEQLADGLDPVPDALGVVQPVDPEQQHLGVAQVGADLRGARPDPRRTGQLVEPTGVDRDREGGGTHPALAGRAGHGDRPGTSRQPGPAPHDPQEVGGVAGPLEPDQVRAQQALDDLPPPRQLGEQLKRREGDVVEVTDQDVVAQLAQHRRDQLELVVVDPHRPARRRLGGGCLGEPAVDPAVGLPPAAVVDRRADHVVRERPQGVVGEALVEVGEVVLGEPDRDQVHAVGLERRGSVAGLARPADPGAVGLAHHRLHRGDQAAGGALPGDRAVARGGEVDREAVGHHYERVRHEVSPPAVRLEGICRVGSAQGRGEVRGSTRGHGAGSCARQDATDTVASWSGSDSRRAPRSVATG